MNVSLKNCDAVSGIVKLEIEKADYAELVDKSLKNFRQKANVPGFRKGMVPMGMVKKMYGTHVLVEEVNKLVSENLYKYIRENDVNILGEPLPNQTEQKEIDFNKEENFEFCFDVAFAPQLNINLSKDDKVPFYTIEISDEMLNQQIEGQTARYGKQAMADNVEERDMVKGTLAELENGVPKEGGIVVDNAVQMPLYIKSEEERAKFIGQAVNSVVIFNPATAYEGADAELASFLQIKKEEVASYTGDFSFEIKEIVRHQKAEMNQELFDAVYGEGVVTSEAEFVNKVKEGMESMLIHQSNYKFLLDLRAIVSEKVGDLVLADGLLKRWLLVVNERNTMESLEENYPAIKEDLKGHLIKNTLAKTFDVKVGDADILETAKRTARVQFAQYGMVDVPEAVLENYAKEMIKKREDLESTAERALEEKLAICLKEQVTLDVTHVTIEQFNKFFEEA